MQIRKTANGELVNALSIKEIKGGATALVFGDKGKTLYSSNSMDNIVQWNVKTGKAMKIVENEGSGSSWSCCFSDDANFWQVVRTTQV